MSTDRLRGIPGFSIDRVAATPMRDWGDVNGDRFVRLVFSNEPVERLQTLGARVARALDA